MATMTTPKLGILAGRGALPARLIDACRRQGRAFFVIAFNGQADHPGIAAVPHAWMRVGALGGVIDRLKAEDCREVVLAGGIARPSLAGLRPDLRMVRLIARIGLTAPGDDGILRMLADAFEQEGFRLVAAHEVLPDLLAPAGVLGAVSPDAQARADIARGIEVIDALGTVDVGQGCVVQQGMVLAVEAIEGTDAMIGRCATLGREGPGGVLVKMSKPGQERRIDVPTIGPKTVDAVRAAGLRGIALEAGGAQILEHGLTVARADAAGLFVTGVGRDGG